MQKDNDWNDYLYFLRVAEGGSLKKAASILGVNNSTVFRRINSLEDKLGARLFERLKTGYLLTEAGKEVLQRIQLVEEHMYSVQRIVKGKDENLRGSLKISTTDTIGFYWLPPYIRRFKEQYPEILIDLIINNQFTDLSQREADIVIPAKNRQPDYMVGRKLAPIVFKLCASKEYVGKYGQPEGIEEISTHHFVLPDGYIAGIPSHKWLRNYIGNNQVVACSDKLTGLHRLAQQGLGITLLPEHVIQTDPDLVILMGVPEHLSQEIWMLTHPDLRQVARVKAFFQFMGEATRGLRV
ncbi:LysR family transcriptional regulator [Desulfogranum japonicum]|uniref:LysR family transcriptional regulator n=1 Tax=Desulfogranum japonicum TaxID=231447 RepID=UPI00041C64E6|nr:LysR family transcriptional regulator [Desulfogranum japonicum]